MDLFKAALSRLLALVLVLSSLTGCQSTDHRPSLSLDTLFHLTLVHMNDTHSYLEASHDQKLTLAGTVVYTDLGSYPRLIAKIREASKNNDQTLVLHAGDSIQGTLYFSRYNGDADMDLLNLMGLDAMVLGNHEFDKGPAFLGQFLGKARFPVLSANVEARSVPDLAGKFQPYIIKSIHGQQVAVIGVTTPATRFISNPGNQVQFNDLPSTVTSWVHQMEAMGINKIMVLSHQGYDEDKALAASVDGIDVIVGGHSHTLLGGESILSLGLGTPVAGPYPTPVTGPDGGTCYVVQAGSHGLGLGILDMVFDDRGVIRNISGNPVLLTGDRFRQKDPQGNLTEVDEGVRKEILTAIDGNPGVEAITEDPEALAVLEKYRPGIREIKSRQIALVPQDLRHSRIPPELFSEETGKPDQGSDIVPLVCRSMLWKMRQLGYRVDLALVNTGGIRRAIPAGHMTLGDILEVMPFNNTLVVMELTGRELYGVLQDAVDRASRGNTGAFPGLAGARMIFRSREAGAAPILESLEIMDNRQEGKPLDLSETYTLVTSSYLSGGGDYYTRLENFRGKRYDTGFVDSQVFMEYAGTLSELVRPSGTWLMVLPLN
ncbi:MAG: 5'-nucleotidase C-terminal domain-containing protein [Pseudomonadota bacterium]